MASTHTLKPQDWTEVVSPPQAVADAVGALVPDTRGEPLTTAQLAALSTAIAADENLWRPLVVADTERRRYRLMYEDDRVDIWVAMWMPGQGTGYHDHAISGVGVAGADGMAFEKQMLLPSGASEVEMRPGVTREGPPGYIHSVAHGEGTPAVTIHSYSPPLMEVGQYRVDDNGTLQRHIEHGRQELLDNTIAKIAPDIV